MTSAQRFANYPEPKECKVIDYKVEQDNNPSFNGLPLVVGAAIVSRIGFVQKLLFNNAGFGQIRNISEIKDVNWRFHPTVIPLRDGDAAPEPLAIGSDLLKRQSEKLVGRYHSVADYHALYCSGALSPVDVVEALFPLIQRGQTPKSKYETAWTYVNVDAALARAKESEARYRDGKPLGILDGVPISVKDDCSVEGYKTCNGMKPKDGEHFFDVRMETIWPVKKLEEAGAIVVGKNSMHELGSDTTGCNPYWGVPPAWHNTSYYPGGSSSGPASAVCAGLIPIAVATDAGGSIRIPPAFNGLYGLKTSHDRTYVMNSTVCVTGPLCSTAADLTIAYRIMSQQNPDDSTQGLFATSIPPSPEAKKTIGICRPWFNRAEKPVLDDCMKAVDFFANSCGYEVVDVELPYLREGQLAHAALCLAEMADTGRSRANNPADWLSLVNSPNKVLMTVGSQSSAGDYVKFGQMRQVIMQHLAFLFQKHPGLLIVTPTTPLRGWKRAPGDDKYGFSDPNVSIQNMTYVWMANMTGCPAVVVPVGYADPEQGEGRLPVSLMAMGEWGAEEQLLNWARESEEYLNETYPGGRIRPEAWVDVIGKAVEKKGKRDQSAA